MKKIILSLLISVLLCACSSTDMQEQVILTERTGIVEEVDGNIITVKTDSDIFDIEYEFADSDQIGKDITITLKNGEPYDISIYGKAYETEAKKILSNMTVKEKIGQMLFIRYPESNAEDIVNDYNIGGLIMFAKDFQEKTPKAVKSEITSLQSLSDIPLLIAVDEEGGKINRISSNTAFRSEPFASPQELYAEGGFEKIKADTLEKAAFLKELGINLNLAPVADISEDISDYIYPRTIGLDAEGACAYVTTVIEAMKASKIGSTLKHFPGYGNNIDTHNGIAVDERPYETFINNDLLPFKAGIDAGADCVLVSHNIVKAIDENHPASLSKNAHDILRNILGFDGVIMTDDLDMGAIQQYTENEDAAVMAITAGNDLIICSDYEGQSRSVLNAVGSGEISIERIDESVLRILTLKLKLGLL